jgi:hypothetical protein
MSLQLIAKQMEAKGRKGDSMLVHMTPGEVAGLQKLAEAAGGSLSVNPETGLVEANFLKDLIRSPFFAPLAGAGLMMIPGVGPMMAAGLVGGGTALATGDVGKGAMAGLGAYGGAGLAGGLMGAGNAAASQAATAANPTVMGPMPGAATGLQAAKTGATSLGTEAGRQAFMQGVGGVGGLAKTASMAAAPAMMAPGKKPGDAPVDDEMYYTEYNPGQTGERSSTSTEALQFAGGYSPIERIKAEDYMKRRNRQFSAAQGGLMSLAEGGETAAPSEAAAPALGMPGGIGEPTMQVIVYGPDGTMYPNPAAARAAGVTNYTMQQPVTEANRIIPRMPDSGATSTAPSSSEAALAYLMGERSSSAPARSPFIDAQLMGASPKSNIGVGGDNMYAFDPATGTFLRNPNVAGATSPAVRGPVGTSFAGSGGDYNAPMSPQTDRFLSWEESTPEGKAHRDARMGEIQNLFNLGPTGAFMSALGGKEAKAPNFGTIFSTPEAYESYIADKDSGIFQGTSQSGGSTRGADWESLPADMRGGDGGGDGAGVDHSSPGPGSNYGGEGEAAGGLISLAKGGMKSGGFVVPADVVSMIGEGNTDAGYSRIKSMIPGATAIKGKDGGQADTVKTSIEGKQPARVAHGEMYIPPETVKRMGGAKKLYAMMDRVREQATGSKKQIKPVSLKRAMA